MSTHCLKTILWVLAMGISALSNASELPATSIYHLDVKLTDQHGTNQSLDTFAGHPVIVSMF